MHPSKIAAFYLIIVGSFSLILQVCSARGELNHDLLGGIVRDLPDLAKQASAWYQASEGTCE